MRNVEYGIKNLKSKIDRIKRGNRSVSRMTFGLPDLVIQIDEKVVHKSPFHIGSELIL